MSHDTLPLEGLTILVVEDEPLIALDIATALEDAGANVAGPCASVDQALRLIERLYTSLPLNGAVLDVNLGTQTSVPIAHVLRDKGVPFVFHTGILAKDTEMLKEFDVQVIRKPAASAILIAAVAVLLERPGD